VLHDVLGLSEVELTFTRRYADLRAATVKAAAAYVDDVRAGTWPDDEHSFH
jgi:3-methyl-2-oxobutanoate hydroxymethyltransferase